MKPWMNARKLVVEKKRVWAGGVNVAVEQKSTSVRATQAEDCNPKTIAHQDGIE